MMHGYSHNSGKHDKKRVTAMLRMMKGKNKMGDEYEDDHEYKEKRKRGMFGKHRPEGLQIIISVGKGKR